MYNTVANEFENLTSAKSKKRANTIAGDHHDLLCRCKRYSLL